MFRFPFVYVFRYLCGSLALFAIIEGLSIAKPVAMLIVVATSIVMTFVLARLAFHGQPAGAQFSARQGPS